MSHLILLFHLIFSESINTYSFDLKRHQIHSEKMGYTINYVVALPENYDRSSKYPIIYMTDGPTVEKESTYFKEAEEFQKRHNIDFISVLVSPIDSKTGVNRRNYELLGNEKYYAFFIEELIPELNNTYSISRIPSDTYLEGVSFGGLNALYFGLLDEGKTFGSIAVLSPAIHPKKSLLSDYRNNEKLPIRFFLSSGTFRDNEATTREIKKALQRKKYELGYNEVPYAHNMKNWDANWKPMLEFLFSTNQLDR